MKHSILALALLTCTLTAGAQKSWVSITLNDYWADNIQNTSSDNAAAEVKFSGVSMLPSVGYYRFVGKTWGLGLELGYRNVNYNNNFSFLASNGDFSSSVFSTRSTGIFICPSLFENYAWNKFRATASLSVPLEYTWNNRSESSGLSTYTNPSQPATEGRNTSKYPNQLGYGVYGNIGIQHRIAGGFYFGPSLGVGFSGTFSNGETKITTFNTQLPTGQQETVETVQVHDFRSRINVRPTVSLSYYF